MVPLGTHSWRRTHSPGIPVCQLHTTNLTLVTSLDIYKLYNMLMNGILKGSEVRLFENLTHMVLLRIQLCARGMGVIKKKTKNKVNFLNCQLLTLFSTLTMAHSNY